jgi:hypothetical protein
MHNYNIFKNSYPVEFTYMLGRSVLHRVNSINDLGVIMDEKMNFSDHIDVMVGIRLLRCLMSFDFRDL